MLRRAPQALRWRQLAPPLLIVGLAVSLGLLLIGQRVWAALVPALYAAGIVGTTVIELVRRRSLAALGLPLVLPTMHFSWALGFMTSDVADNGPSIPDLEAG